MAIKCNSSFMRNYLYLFVRENAKSQWYMFKKLVSIRYLDNNSWNENALSASAIPLNSNYITYPDLRESNFWFRSFKKVLSQINLRVGIKMGLIDIHRDYFLR